MRQRVQDQIPDLGSFVPDRMGTHRDSWRFSTKLSLTTERVIASDTGCWSIEITVQEPRSAPGLER